VSAVDQLSVAAWIADYERAWRTPGTEPVTALFTTDATYRTSPFAEAHRGLAAIRRLWEEDRAGADEHFDLTFDIITIDPPRAVVRLDVRYAPPRPDHFRNLWVLACAADGRCEVFEEWPYTATQPVPHHVPSAPPDGTEPPAER